RRGGGAARAGPRQAAPRAGRPAAGPGGAAAVPGRGAGRKEQAQVGRPRRLIPGHGGARRPGRLSGRRRPGPGHRPVAPSRPRASRRLASELGAVVVLMLTDDESGSLRIGVSVPDDLVPQLPATELLDRVLSVTGGRGGGSAAFAQGGGARPDDLPALAPRIWAALGTPAQPSASACPFSDIAANDARVIDQWPCHGPVPWPCADYASAMKDYMGVVGDIGHRLLQLTALGLGLDDIEHFTRLTEDGMHRARRST